MALTLHGTVADNTVALDRRNAKPIIINGDMAVAQRGTSVASLSSDSYATVDRMKQKLNDAGTYTISQSTDVPSGYGFTKSLKYDVTTAKDSPSSGTLGSLDYHVEAQDLKLLNYGTSGAKKITFSFWVKSPKTGTHILSITAPDGNRHISKAYTVSSANTWENHICNFDGDTSGTINDDNGSGFQLQWLLVAGSSYQSGTLQTSWGSYTQANTYVGQVNCADNTSNNFFITGIQMEVGEFDANSIPPFQHESYGDSLVRCQRYFYRKASGNDKNVCSAAYYSNTIITSTFTFPVEMRTAPSLVQVTGTNYYIFYRTGANDQFDGFTHTFAADSSGIALDVQSGASGTMGHGGRIATLNDAAFIGFEAEL